MADLYDMAALIGKITGLAKSESRRLVSFVLIGIVMLGLNVAVYAALSRLIWPNGSHQLEYAFTVIVVTALNYEANRFFTFDKAERSLRTATRFALIAVVAFILNNALFWLGHGILGLYDLYVIVFVTLLVACVTFTGHRYFTFRQKMR